MPHSAKNIWRGHCHTQSRTCHWATKTTTNTLSHWHLMKKWQHHLTWNSNNCQLQALLTTVMILRSLLSRALFAAVCFDCCCYCHFHCFCYCYHYCRCHCHRYCYHCCHCCVEIVIVIVTFTFSTTAQGFWSSRNRPGYSHYKFKPYPKTQCVYTRTTKHHLVCGATAHAV